MAGGIYINRPFSPNIKCIIFSFFMMAYYWTSSKFTGGKPNNLLYPLIFIIAYVAMAWYDVIYNCSDRLYSGVSGPAATISSIFKDQLRTYKHTKKDIVLDQEDIYQKNVYLTHLLMIVPIIMFVGVQGYRDKLGENSKDWYMLLNVLGLGAFVYHGFRFFKPRQTCNIITDDKGNIKSINKGNLPK
jgi:hypothetical protein